MLLIAEAKSKFGILNAEDKKWYNPQDKKTLDKYVIGKAYDVLVEPVKGSDGKVRPQITKMSPVGDKPAEQIAAVVSAAPPAVKSVATGLSFGEKDARILYQGVAQALVQSSLVLSLKDLEPAVVHVVEMIKRLSGTK